MKKFILITFLCLFSTILNAQTFEYIRSNQSVLSEGFEEDRYYFVIHGNGIIISQVMYFDGYEGNFLYTVAFFKRENLPDIIKAINSLDLIKTDKLVWLDLKKNIMITVVIDKEINAILYEPL